jgi:alkylated DNA repair dioxygenase AlkB
MDPIIRQGYVKHSGFSIFEKLRDEVAWVNRSSPRDECFMAAEGAPKVYSYGNDNTKREELHTYHAVEMHPLVLGIMQTLNAEYGTEYNVCVLNYYKDRHQHLGWHADDSPEQDLDHPIAVIAFGAEREIWWKRKDYKGPIPASQKFLMTEGSLFIMPGGFQAEHFHRIPKHDRECGGRISLTFRKLVR